MRAPVGMASRARLFWAAPDSFVFRRASLFSLLPARRRTRLSTCLFRRSCKVPLVGPGKGFAQVRGGAARTLARFIDGHPPGHARAIRAIAGNRAHRVTGDLLFEDIQTPQDGLADDVGSRGGHTQTASHMIDESFGPQGNAPAHTNGQLRCFGVDPGPSGHAAILVGTGSEPSRFFGHAACPLGRSHSRGALSGGPPSSVSSRISRPRRSASRKTSARVARVAPVAHVPPVAGIPSRLPTCLARRSMRRSMRAVMRTVSRSVLRSFTEAPIPGVYVDSR
jgi:hypothetical protein